MADAGESAAGPRDAISRAGERELTLVALLGLLAAASWGALLAWSASPYARYLVHDSWGDVGALAALCRS
ncbi:MAG TPA: hypothetical protein VMU79_06150, partial [Casimicrobiaceae bacterium]|nr:hypothetical protein [Casimicrobiaceae bacterium]